MTNLLENQKLSNIVNISKNVYMSIFTVYLIVRLVTALHYYIDSLLITGFFFGMAGIFIGYDILTNRYCLKTRYLSALIIFLTITVISCIINYEYGIFSNIKGIAGLVIYMFLIYPEAFNQKSHRTLTVISYTACFTLCAFTLASIPMYLYDVSYYTSDNISQGFYIWYNRLWGLYEEPGYASLYALISISLSVLLFTKTKSTILKILLVFCDFVQIIYISLGGSRMATLAVMVALAWISLIIVFKKIKVKIVYKFFIFLLCVGVSVVAPIIIINGINTGIPYVKRFVLNNTSPQAYIAIHEAYDKIYQAGKIEIVEGLADEINLDDFQNEETVQPVDRSDNPTEISNGRFDRWIDGIKILLKSPLFGTSPRNIVSFAKDFASNTLMGKYDYSIHNTYLETLAGVGIFGGIALLLFLILAAIHVIKIGFKMSFDVKTTVCSTIVLIIAFSAILLPDIIFFQITFPGLLFWLCLGYCLNTDPRYFQQSFTYKAFKKLLRKRK